MSPPVGAARSGLLGVASGFSPADIASLAHWYDATELTGFNDGDSVGTWPDEEGTDDLTQGTGASQPTYQTNVINGNPIIRGDGTDDRMDTSFASLSTPYQVFVVVQLQSSGATTKSVWGEDGSGGPGLLQNGNGNWSMKYDGETDIEDNSTDTSAHIITTTWASSASIRVDGAQTGSGSRTGESMDGLTVFDRGLDDLPSDSDVGEIIVVDDELSTTVRDDTEDYLSTKWGISI